MDYSAPMISMDSSALQLLNVLEKWCDILDEDGIIDDVNMDFRKAFDSVPHKRLLGKLESYGITGELHGWIAAFLTGRKQQVSVNGHKSSWKAVTSGVPQGSVIAALMFVIYINDLPENIKAHIYLFADDLKFFHEITTDEDTALMQNDLHLLNAWSKKWLLTFHPDKCVTLRLSLRKDPGKQVYYLDSEPLKNVGEVKDLEVIVDTKLKFSKQISTKVNKANQTWGTIKRTFKHMNEEIFKKLYCSHVRCHLEYAIQFWSPYLKKDIASIEAVQRRATKSIDALKGMSYEQRLRKLKLPTLAYRRLRGSMIEMFKIFNVYDDEIAPKFNIKQGITRGHNLKLYAKASKKNHPKHHSFHHRVVNPWNSLPSNVVNAPSLDAFKNRLDQHWSSLSLRYNYLAADF